MEIWFIFSSLRISSAINGFAGMFAIWLAARFASVMMDKGPNMLAKVIVSVFGFCVILMNVMFLMMAQNVLSTLAKPSLHFGILVQRSVPERLDLLKTTVLTPNRP